MGGIATLPPQSVELEQSVLGSLMIDPDALSEVMGIIQPADFYRESHGMVYSAMLSLRERLLACDYLTVVEELESRKQLDDVGGASYIASLINSVPTSLHAAAYAQVVKDHAQRRKIIRAAGEMAAAAYKTETPINDLLADVSAKFFAAVDASNNGGVLVGSNGVIEDYLANQQTRADKLKNDPFALLKTGMPNLDELLGDIEPGDFIVVGAKTSIGKTAFMESVAENIALRGKTVAYYHLELQTQKMLDRMFARYSGIPIHELRKGYNGPELHRSVEAVRERLSHLIFIHCPGWTAQEIAANAYQLMGKYGLDLVVVDYLGKIAYPEHTGGLNEAGLIAQQVETIKTMAERMGVPVIMGSQVSRDFKGTADKRPTVNDLKGSGEIENRAQKVIILHRPNERTPDADSEIIEAHVEKNEDGMCGVVQLRHLLGRFHIVSPVEEEEWSPIF